MWISLYVYVYGDMENVLFLIIYHTEFTELV